MLFMNLEMMIKDDFISMKNDEILYNFTRAN